jgi:hypothetical protein
MIRTTASDRLGCKSEPARVAHAVRNCAFIEDYIRARDAWREGHLVAFPQGTYWLRPFANVAIAET